MTGSTSLETGEKTPWFPWRVRPVREGYYEMRGVLMQPGTKMYWNGHQWGYWIDAPRTECWVHLADDESDEWRGLASPP